MGELVGGDYQHTFKRMRLNGVQRSTKVIQILEYFITEAESLQILDMTFEGGLTDEAKEEIVDILRNANEVRALSYARFRISY